MGRCRQRACEQNAAQLAAALTHLLYQRANVGNPILALLLLAFALVLAASAFAYERPSLSQTNERFRIILVQTASVIFALVLPAQLFFQVSRQSFQDGNKRAQMRLSRRRWQSSSKTAQRASDLLERFSGERLASSD